MWNISPALTTNDENSLPVSSTDTSAVPDTQSVSSLALACQCGVRNAPGLITTLLIDSPRRIGNVSAVTRVIDPSSDSSTTSPLVNEAACGLYESVIAIPFGLSALSARLLVSRLPIAPLRAVDRHVGPRHHEVRDPDRDHRRRNDREGRGHLGDHDHHRER